MSSSRKYNFGAMALILPQFSQAYLFLIYLSVCFLVDWSYVLKLTINESESDTGWGLGEKLKS